ncbi:MAG: prolyl oligopeptidase family serine peptidase [Chloroflexota bacterium]
MTDGPRQPDTPFHDLDRYIAIPRLSGLAISRDGSRLVTGVQTLDPERTAYRTAIWEVDPTGIRAARRLTWSAKGESSAVFTTDGDLLFTSTRPDPDAKPGGTDDAKAALWLLPAAGGEARLVASAAGGVSDPIAARDARVVSVAVSMLPSATDLDHDATLRALRKDHKVAAILHASYPVRYWDHDLGPDQPRRFAGDLAALADVPSAPTPDDATPPGRTLRLRELTGAGRQLFEHGAALSPDGTTMVTTWAVAQAGGGLRTRLVAVDVATGATRTLADDPAADLSRPTVSADGAWVAYLRETISTPERAPVVRLGVVRLDGSDGPRVIADDWDRWPASMAWLPDGSGLVVTADDDGRCPIWLVALAPGGSSAPAVVERVTSDDAAFTDLQVAPDGDALYALRTGYAAPPEPVRIDLAAFLAGGPVGGRPPVAATRLRGPVGPPELPGTLREVATVTPDGARIRGWLALPADAAAASPAPLLLWIHGGPLSSWNGWSWRWNPWLMVARGYAVLLPDPALSTGYGQAFIQRGWGGWGHAPYTDLMAITDAAGALPEVDAARSGAMGGSFGGYMANWVAGHTDRFRAIVTHASLWALDQFGPTTDVAFYWGREMTPAMALANSPHRHVGDIRTPMLVIHGDHDYRVPIGEGLRLWFELLSASGLPAGEDGTTAHRFLYFPDENHWVLSPQHAKVWYQTVLAFLAEHLLGEPAELPETLG